MDAAPAYGLWGLVAINSAVFIIFAFSFFRPKTRRDWTSVGAASSLVIALFVEFAVLVVVYFRLARREEAEVRAEFGDAFERYAAAVPAFILRWSSLTRRRAAR